MVAVIGELEKEKKKKNRELTATIMAGLVASLSGTYVYIWILVGLLPKSDTDCRLAQKPLAAKSARAEKDDNCMMRILF